MGKLQSKLTFNICTNDGINSRANITCFNSRNNKIAENSKPTAKMISQMIYKPFWHHDWLRRWFWRWSYFENSLQNENKQTSTLTLQLFIILIIKPITTTTRLLKSHGVSKIIDSLWRSLEICINMLLSVVYTKIWCKYF